MIFWEAMNRYGSALTDESFTRTVAESAEGINHLAKLYTHMVFLS